MVRIDGHPVRLTRPERVLYPRTGTTKAQVLEYYVAVAPAMLPHLAGRPATRKRWPEGVDGESFFAKDLEPGVPDWLTRVRVDHTSGPKWYPLLDGPAALAWLAQVAALEVHVPQWRLDDADPDRPATTTRSTRWPDRVVFDLDPGPGVGLAECVEVALLIRERLDGLGARTVPVTSGSKGVHLYVPMDQPITSAAASDWARQVAEHVERELPQLVVSRMTRALRAGKVLVDWSQNNAKKTTIAPYSLRGRDEPTVAAPRTWAELTEPGLVHLDHRQVLDRLAAGIDPLAGWPGPAATGSDGPPPTAARRRARAGPGGPSSPAWTRRPATGDDAAGPSAADPAAATGAGGGDGPSGTPGTSVASGTDGTDGTDGTGPGAVQHGTEGADRALPEGLAGPVGVELARAEDAVPGPNALPGGCRYELKWDGYRLAVVRDAKGVRLWSRQGHDLTHRFPEIAAAARAQLPPGTVADGEVVIWNGARLDFDLLQRRLATRPRDMAAAVRAHPASFVVFDLLADRGEDLRPRPLRERRDRLERAAPWRPPLQLSPVTGDVAQARAWMADYRPAGVEGLVAKGADTPYAAGRRDWIKVKSRETEEVVVGGVLGSRTAPESVVAGLYRGTELVLVGRTTVLTAAQSRALAAVLQPAEPDHPWPDRIGGGRFARSREAVPLTRVAPTVVVEVSADTGRQGGVWRHALRYVRIRADVRPEDLPRLPDDDGPAPAGS
ncbi:non-homologous end-joining DNA ligase [Nakamurella endophytica]|uniref:ATP-dependent DNA ligase family profile domain-containing protein n=1 Tax=Nakamurella endophytica TaxID=1748367 RepID=A0A917WL70_9ACTN|nr:non-homologous end-joining DNA ligase [Nakamurella endophytica]GGM12357.1 hypothetical protein GCM10011594_35290 [Nakamurella endophytica]